MDDSPAVVRSDIWYSDGSIVIQARETQFRVHATVLSAQSTVLKDMFAVGTAAGSEVVEGCPVVELSDDAVDVAHILRMLYDQSHFDTRTKIPFDVLAAAIRLGKKYDMQYIYDRAVWCITEDVPERLYKWDKIQPNSNGFRLANHIQYRRGLLLQLTRLIRTEGLLYVLPQLLFSAFTYYGLDGIMEGHDGDDGHVKGLSHEDVLLSFRGFIDMHDASLDILKQWAFEKADKVAGCESSSCAHQSAMMALNMMDCNYNILDERSKPPADLMDNICDECRSAFTAFYVDARQRLWAKLPSFFGMPDWHQLRKDCGV